MAASTPEEHDKIMRQVVKIATEWNLKLNFNTCHYRKSSVKFVGHLLSDKGLEADSEKIRAVKDVPAPENKDDIRRFRGFIQYCQSFYQT